MNLLEIVTTDSQLALPVTKNLITPGKKQKLQKIIAGQMRPLLAKTSVNLATPDERHNLAVLTNILELVNKHLRG